jgi:urea transport system permease protein
MITSFLLRAVDQRILVVIGILLAAAVLVPVSHLALGPDNFLHIPTFIV